MNICRGTVSGWRSVLVKCGAALNPLKLLESGGFFTQPISDAKIDQNPNLLWIYELKHPRTCERNKKKLWRERDSNKEQMRHVKCSHNHTNHDNFWREKTKYSCLVSYQLTTDSYFFAKKCFEHFNNKKYDILYFFQTKISKSLINPSDR